MVPPAGASSEWDIAAARSLYNVDRWGAGYFDINTEGHVVAKPQQNGVEVDIMDIVEEARARNLKFPLLVRFQDILRHRVVALNDSAAAGHRRQGAGPGAGGRGRWSGSRRDNQPSGWGRGRNDQASGRGSGCRSPARGHH